MVSIPRSSDKNRCNRLFRLSLSSSVTTRHTTSFRFKLRKHYYTFQSEVQTSSSFSYRSAQTLRPGSEPESRPGERVFFFGPGRQTLHKTLRTLSEHTFSQREIIRVYVRNDSRRRHVTTCELTRQSQWERTCKWCSKFRIYFKNECGENGFDGAQETNWNII